MSRCPDVRILVVLAWVLCLTLAPLAAASAVDRVSWSSSFPLALAGAASVDARGGVALVEDAHARGTSVLDLGNGTITISSWRIAETGVPPEYARVAPPIESAQDQHFTLRATRLVLRSNDDPLSLTLAARDGGVVRVEGTTDVSGFPVRLDHAYVPYPVDPVTSPAAVFHPPPYIDWRWEAGWLFCGHYPQASVDGFPSLLQPTLRLRGPAEVLVLGGTASFVDGNGVPQEFVLGNSADPSAPSSPAVTVERQTWLHFQGDVEDAAIVPSGPWGLAGPDVAWGLRGTVATTHATGEYQDPTGVHPFLDEPIQATGAIALAPLERSASDLLAPFPYDASGRIGSLSVGDARIVQPEPRAILAPAVELTALGILVLLLTKLGREIASRALAPLYTRLAPSDLLRHAGRRRLVEAVTAEPGVHLREAGRRAGLSWGALRFHAGMLRRAGILHFRREGGRILVYPASFPSSAKPVLNPVAKRILDALPSDGAPVDIHDLRRTVGVSRQLLSYHLRGLAEDGRVSVAGSRPTLVSRPLPQAQRVK